MARLYFNPLNPIAVREMKTRMRGPRTFALLALYLSLLAVVIFVVYVRKGASGPYNYGGTLLSGNFGPTRNYETGQDMFIAVFLYLLVVMAIITPTVCAGLISREMEQRTYDMLLVTPVRGRTLIFGKLLANLGYLTLLLLMAFPISCIVFVFGGVTFEQILIGFGLALTEMIVIGIMSLFFSGLFRRTSLALIMTYSLTLLLLLGVPIISSSIVASINSDTSRPNSRLGFNVDPAFDLPRRVLVFNPFAALGSVLAPNAPYRPGREEDLQYFPNSRLFWGNPNGYYATPIFTPGSPVEYYYKLSKLPILPNQLSLWQGYLLVYAGIGLFFLVLSFGVVKPLPRRPGLNPLRGVRRAVASRRKVSTKPGAVTVADPNQNITTLEPATEQPIPETIENSHPAEAVPSVEAAVAEELPTEEVVGNSDEIANPPNPLISDNSQLPVTSSFKVLSISPLHDPKPPAVTPPIPGDSES